MLIDTRMDSTFPLSRYEMKLMAPIGIDVKGLSATFGFVSCHLRPSDVYSNVRVGLMSWP